MIVRKIVLALALIGAQLGFAAADDVAMLDAFSVKADRFEDFGFRADDAFPDGAPRRRSPVGNPIIGIVREVWPNTAAAKAGLKPGDRILKSDGRALTANLLTEDRWGKLTWQKFVEARKGKEVKWGLEIQSADSKESRTVTLVVPSAPPRWGASIWQPPVGRVPAMVNESGPLAERAREVLNSGVWAMFDADLARNLGLRADGARPPIGFYWDIREQTGPRSGMLHRMFATQQRGRTEIVFMVRSWTDRSVPEKTFLTSPGGALGIAWTYGKSGKGTKTGDIPLPEADADFRRELDFWLTRVGKVSPQWPLELIPEKKRRRRAGLL